MKSLIKLVTILALVMFLASCGKGKSSSSSGSSSSSSTINNPVTSINDFYSRVVNQQFAVINGNYSYVEYGYNDLDYDYDFSRDYDKLDGTIHRDDDNRNTKQAIVSFLVSIINGRQYFIAGCNIYPHPAYSSIFNRQYLTQDCYTFYKSGTTYYIDLNYPLEANPIAMIKYTVTEDEWWIFDTYKQTVDGYYLYDIYHF